MIIRIRSEREGERVIDRLFAGPDRDHLELAGRLVWKDVGEWQLFGAALLLGADDMRWSDRKDGPLIVEHPDDAEIVANWGEEKK